MSYNLNHLGYRFNQMWHELHLINLIQNKLDNLRSENKDEINIKQRSNITS
jgi:hypothetical protein